MTKEIELTQGYKTIVDDEDFEYLSQFKWQYHYGYARRAVKNINNPIIMHRIILERKLGRKLTSSELTDHKDRSRLNNTRDNLRVATRRQNNINSSNRTGTSSPFRGVYWRKDERKWYARIKVHKKAIHLGSFDDQVLAAKAYDKNAILWFGEFAVLNFPNITVS